MTGPLADICVNLLNGQFNSDRADVIARAKSNRVAFMAITATDLDSTRTAQTQLEPGFSVCTAGIHPHDIGTAEPDWLSQLRDLAQHPGVRAIGETGLDFNRNYSSQESQLVGFNAQIELAIELHKPLFVHDRESDGEVLNCLSRHRNLPPVVVHCFTGSEDELDGYLAAGFYIGITGWLCDQRRGQPLRDIVTRIPLERLMIETDAPFLRPHNAPPNCVTAPVKRRNEPALLSYVVDVLAALYQRPADEIAAATYNNAIQFFGAP